MRRLPILLLTLSVATGSLFTLHAGAQEAPGGPPAQGAGPGGGDNGPPPPPPRGQAGGVHIIPPFVRDKLNLTADQMTQIAALEKETKAKLDKILTADQQKIMAETRPPRPPGGGPGNGQRGGPAGGGGPRGGGMGGGPGGGPGAGGPGGGDGAGPPQ